MNYKKESGTPVKPGLWTSDGKKEYLMGSHCKACGEILFPKKEHNFCPQCHESQLENIQLSDQGSIQSFTIVNQQPAGGFYKGPVPYCYGVVQLPEGVNVITLFTDSDWEKIELNQQAQLVIEKLSDDTEEAVLTYKFNPIF